MKQLILTLLLLASLGPVSAQDLPDWYPDFQEEIKTTVARHFPTATFESHGRCISFEAKARDFMVHLPLKTGEWQKATKVRGPKKGGVVGSLELVRGPYQGAAAVPQSFNRHYFEVWLQVVPMRADSGHIRITLSEPTQAKANFAREVQQVAAKYAAMGL